MKDIVRLIRPINLLIIIATQYLFFKVFISVQSSDEAFDADANLLVLSICVLTLMAGICGYIINQYYDQQTDAFNKKNQLSLRPKTLLWTYIVLSIISHLFFFQLCLKFDVLTLCWVYPLSFLLLFLYSHSFQRISTLGNLIVAGFSAGVMAVVLVLPSILPNIFAFNTLKTFAYLFICFAFMISWIREIVKDVQDQHGDALAGYKTLVISLGFERTKAVCYFLLVLLFIIEISAAFYLYNLQLHWMYIFSILTLPHWIYLFLQFNKWHASSNHAALSKALKIHMVLGILFLLIIIALP